jgi:MFS family permease
MVDKFHTVKVAIPFNIVSAIGALLLLAVSASFGGLPLLYTAVGLGGFALAANRPMGVYFHTRFFGLRAFTEISSLQYAMTNPITAFAAPLIGVIYDSTHTYKIAFLLMAAAPVISGVIWLILPKYRYAANIGEAPVPSAAE